MIFESKAATTAIDVTVIAFAVAMLRSAWSNHVFHRWSRARALILLGGLAIGSFFLVHLVAVHAGVWLIGAQRAAAVLAFLRTDALWLVVPLAVALVATGFLLTGRTHVIDERRLSLMVDALPLAVAYIDMEERYRFANAYFAKIHSRTIDSIIGRTVAEVAGPDVAEIFRQHRRGTLAGKHETYTRRMRLADGQLRDLHGDLVLDRADDGSPAGFFLLLRDETQRVQLEREVVRAAEAERLSVARDLHDSLGQALTGISLALSALARKLSLEGSQHVPLLADLIATTQQTIGQTRQFTHLLAPTMRGGLFGAVRALGREVSSLYDVECIARCPAEEIPMSAAAATHLYRIAQESVNNALRHGRAGTIYVDCRVDGDALVLEVIDNGAGIPAAGQRQDGIGLSSMRYRARMLGGVLRVQSRAAGGTEVSCRVPLAFLTSEPEARQVEPAA